MNKDRKEQRVEKMNVEKSRELAHIMMITQGASANAKAWFRRPAYSNQGVK